MTKKCYLLDLDGTMYRGTAIIEGAKVFIEGTASFSVFNE